MSFWSGEKLGAELPNLITPFDKNRIDCAAYTLRVGPEAYISPSTREEATRRTKVSLDEKQGIVIPPGQFAFLLTEEHVEVPGSAIAFISMKARIKFKGLVNVSGFHVDPGYRGRLVFAVFNAGPAPVHLARGDDCFLIWYASLDRASTVIRQTGPFEGITSELLNPISGEVQSLQGLSDRLNEIEHEQHAANVRTGILITLAFGLMILAITLIAKAWPAAATPLSPSPKTSQDAVPSISSPAPPAGSPSSDRPVGQSQNPQRARTPPSLSGAGDAIRGRSQPPPK